MHRITVGDVTILSVNDTHYPFPAREVYPGVAEVERRFRQYLDHAGNVNMPFQSFILLDGETTVIVDTGYGPDYQGQLLTGLAAAGITREHIDIVFMTHLHEDHTGWNIDHATGQPNFPNATYLVPRRDWEHFRSGEHPTFERDVRPLEALGRLELVTGGHHLTPAITTVPTPGHTPGHTSIAITSGAEQAFITGDVICSEVEVALPAVESIFDEDQPAAIRTRIATIDRLITERTLVAAGHLPLPGLGHIIGTGDGPRWQSIDA